jgi:hypothetical protein
MNVNKRWIAIVSILSILGISPAVGASEIKYTNQKVGLLCAKSLQNKRVVLPNQHILECKISTTKPYATKWFDVTRPIVKVDSASLIAPKFSLVQSGTNIVISVTSDEINSFLARYPTGKIIAKLVGPDNYLKISTPATPSPSQGLTFTRTEASGPLKSGAWVAQLSVSLDDVQGNWSNSESLFAIVPTPTSTPISTPTPTPTPTSTQNSFQNSAGCVPLYEPQYPIASQRISILGIQWVKDAQGYVTANVTMRNDNTMNLRLVEYSFYYWLVTTRKSTSYNAGGSIIPKHFVKDDPAFMGLEQTPGSWLPGQIRTFAIQTNEIFNCNILSFFPSDFIVTTGVGG